MLNFDKKSSNLRVKSPEMSYPLPFSRSTGLIWMVEEYSELFPPSNREYLQVIRPSQTNEMSSSENTVFPPTTHSVSMYGSES